MEKSINKYGHPVKPTQRSILIQKLAFYIILFILAVLFNNCSSSQPPRAFILLPTVTPTLTATPSIKPSSIPISTPENGPCSIPNLGEGQHIALSGSYTETQTAAAGRMVCRIERDKCPYQHLVGNLDPSIVYKQEEEPPFDKEDILMHPAMLLPLYRLNELIRLEWNGDVRLRITDAYDSLLEHDLEQSNVDHRNSLHFEGRAVDLTTWPIDQARYGRLCALAHCAGFDWVHHEGDHCHAAIKAESLCQRCSNLELK